MMNTTSSTSVTSTSGVTLISAIGSNRSEPCRKPAEGHHLDAVPA